MSVTYKFIVIGSSAVGKTAILKRLVEDEFEQALAPTVGVEYSSYLLDVDSTKVKLQIWDTAGQERFRSISKTYFRNAVGVILVFDLTEQKSFEDVNGWLNDVHQHCSPDCEILLVGNKVDLEDKRIVTISEAEQFAKHHQISYIETSAQNGHNIKEAFVKTATELVRKGMKSSPPIKMTPLPDESGCNC